MNVHAHTHTQDVWLLVVCVIYLNEQQHQSGLLPGSDPQEKYSSIWLSERDFETFLLTLVGWGLSNPPQRTSGSVPVGFSSKVMVQRRNRISSFLLYIFLLCQQPTSCALLQKYF